MSIVEPDRPGTRKFVAVTCPCGRALRATIDMAGREITCWECQRQVRVPMPHSTERAFRVITDGLREVFEARWLFALFLGAAAMTGVLCVPGIGVPLSLLVLFAGALGYGELIRQCGIGVWDFDDWKKPALLLPRIGIAALAALGVAAPMLLSPGGLGHAPRFHTFGLLLGLVGSLIMPLALFTIYARDDQGPLGWQRAGSVILRYPVATALALLLVPVGVVVAEMVVVVVTSWQGMFPFLVLDLFPGSEYFAEQYGIPKYGNYTRPILPDARFFHLYARRLHQGFSLTGALPASLSLKTFVLASPWTLELTDMDYLRIRASYSQVATTILFAFMAMQARWLGAISALESKRSLEVDV